MVTRADKRTIYCKISRFCYVTEILVCSHISATKAEYGAKTYFECEMLYDLKEISKDNTKSYFSRKFYIVVQLLTDFFFFFFLQNLVMLSF